MAQRILFLSKGDDSASTRYRATDYFPLLRAQGFEPEHLSVSGGFRAYARALQRAGQCDVVVVIRKTFGPLFRTLLARRARRLLFDFDDAIFCNTDGSPSATRMGRFVSMIAACDHIMAGNRFLAETARRYNPAVTLVPTTIDAAKYDLVPSKPNDNFDIVWIGSSSTRKYLESALPGLRLAARHIPGLRLKIVADFDLPDAGVPTLAVPWQADIEAKALVDAHVGIAPMVDNDWTRGKCALKVLQYMAASLPVVSSPAGVNAEVVAPGITGELARTPEEWADALVRLANDVGLRESYGAAGRSAVLSGFTRERAFASLLNVVGQ